jgi:site-specific DNA-methyltransferase (adenine-specific)
MSIEFLFNFCYTALEVLWKRGQRMKPITKNTLFYGDNLFILREHIPTESVDLIYLDPPFNSSRNYNVLFKDEHGTDSEAQITAFENT